MKSDDIISAIADKPDKHVKKKLSAIGNVGLEKLSNEERYRVGSLIKDIIKHELSRALALQQMEHEKEMDEGVIAFTELNKRYNELKGKFAQKDQQVLTCNVCEKNNALYHECHECYMKGCDKEIAKVHKQVLDAIDKVENSHVETGDPANAEMLAKGRALFMKVLKKELSLTSEDSPQTKPETVANVASNAMDEKERSFIRDNAVDTNRITREGANPSVPTRQADGRGFGTIKSVMGSERSSHAEICECGHKLKFHAEDSNDDPYCGMPDCDCEQFCPRINGQEKI